ncbi:YhdP family protein [Acidocella aminolytica]|jgi:hypothetical protein|nr:AsmA-like C-terminal domain-containing protein [Acidocella aminolytica]SHE53508.1 AsmA-like C-terminal region [Acidocella aminolytica 101 = DSM 11237]
MKFRRGQATWIILDALHQLGRIMMLLVLLVLALFGALGFRLSQGPLEIPHLASRVATRLTGEGINVHVAKAELAWAGYHEGGAVPFVLRLADIAVQTDSGGVLAHIPSADLSLPTADLFGGREPILMRGAGATFPAGDVPVSWYADLWPGPGFSFARGAVYVTVGAGYIGHGAYHVTLRDGSFVLRTARGGGVNVTDGMAQFAQQGRSSPRLTFSFHAHRDKLWHGSLDARLDKVQAQDLAALWPPGLSPDTRAWVTQNITAGTAHDAHFVFDMAANGDLSHFRIDNVYGAFNADDLTLSWLKGAPPLRQLNGSFVMPDMDTAVITATTGETAGVKLDHGTMKITGLSAPDQNGALTLNLSGRVQDVLGILGAPPLNLLDHTPPEIKNATGAAQGLLTINIPFKKDLTAADVTLNVKAELSGVQMATMIPGIGLNDGQVALHTDGETLRATATAQFAGEPASLTVQQDLTAARGNENFTMKGVAGPRLWRAFGLDTPNDVSSAAQGTAPFEFTLNGPPGGTQQAALTVDLTPAGLALPLLGWEKQPGSTGALSAKFALRDGALDGIQDFSMQGPALAIRGHSQGGVFTLDKAQIGRTQASGTLSAPATPGAPWLLRATGAVLDLRQNGMTSHAGKQGASPQPAAIESPWRATLDFGKVYVSKSPAPPLDNVQITAAGQGYDLHDAKGAADEMNVTVAPLSGGRHSLSMQGNDAGKLLRVLGAYNGMRGGQLDLEASFGGGLIQGTLKLSQARLVQAPGFTKILQAATLYGVAEALSGPGLLIDHAVIPFTLQRGVFSLHGADAYSESLGFTASGTVNTKTSICDLDTTIIPAYALNSLPGKIPLIGHLFSAEKGGGLFAVRAHVQGNLQDPQVQANPLSALTPGILRDIFGLGEATPKPKGK